MTIHSHITCFCKWIYHRVGKPPHHRRKKWLSHKNLSILFQNPHTFIGKGLRCFKVMECTGHRYEIHTLVFKPKRRTGPHCKCAVRISFSGGVNHIFRNIYSKRIDFRLFGKFSKQMPITTGNVQNVISVSEHSLFNNLFFMGSCIIALRG